MRILLAAVSFSSSISGVQRHAFNVARCLLQCPEISEVHLVVSPWQLDLVWTAGLSRDPRLIVSAAKINARSLSRNIWYYRELPRIVATVRPDIVHLSYPVPVNRTALKCPVVLTLHDLYPFEIPQNFSFHRVLFNRIVLRQCLRSVDRIACVSETTLYRLRQYMQPQSWSKAVRIYNCVEPYPAADEASEVAGLEQARFLLCVAQHRRNKNIVLLTEVFRQAVNSGSIDPAMKLLVVGIAGPETNQIRRLISNHHMGKQVLLLEGLSEAQMHWCYTRCEALVTLSSIEGFGLPVAEAMLAGCPAVCSDIDAFREVGGEYCHFVSLDQDIEEKTIDAIKEILHSPRKMPQQLPQFSTGVIALQYLALYRNLLEATLPLPAIQAASVSATPEERQFT